MAGRKSVSILVLHRRGYTLSHIKEGGNSAEEIDREELAEYCESHGIVAACFVRSCGEEELEQILKIAHTTSLPELPTPHISGKSVSR